MDDIKKIKHELERCAWFNDGHGLILTPTIIRELKKLGIDGPYIAQSKLNPNA